MFYTNPACLRNKLHDLRNNISKATTDVIAITESRNNYELNDVELSAPDSKLLRKDCSAGILGDL